MASVVDELTWLEGLFINLGFSIHKPITVLSDCKTTIQLASNPIFYLRTKNIQINFHFISDKVKKDLIKTFYVPTHHQVGDI